jgi:hypothetical protein
LKAAEEPVAKETKPKTNILQKIFGGGSKKEKVEKVVEKVEKKSKSPKSPKKVKEPKEKTEEVCHIKFRIIVSHLTLLDRPRSPLLRRPLLLPSRPL